MFGNLASSGGERLCKASSTSLLADLLMSVLAVSYAWK